MTKHSSFPQGISSISVAGYKSICELQTIEIQPLTIIAGANSSGKSSIMQPLLLMKQTLEASYDPGALLLDGPNVRLTSTDQFFSRIGKCKPADTFSIEIRNQTSAALTTHFTKMPGKDLDISRMAYTGHGEHTLFTPSLSRAEIDTIVPEYLRSVHKSLAHSKSKSWAVARDRCFLKLAFYIEEGRELAIPDTHISPSLVFEPHIREIIHLPGLRGNPERTYPVTAVDRNFPGTFQNYVASIITHWQTSSDSSELDELGRHLAELGLTWKVVATPINDTQVELRVGRLPHFVRGGTSDLVSVADVGLGVSQTLPVLVALLVAKPGQLVYLEQPEIHLHPRAQLYMAKVIADSAQRGVRIVVETHSSLLLLGVQQIVASGQLANDKVKLHWFQRDNKGSTVVESADVDEAGAFGDWPEDFGAISMEAESRYLDAAEARLGV